MLVACSQLAPLHAEMTGEMNQARYFHTANLLDEDRVLVTGGVAGNGPLVGSAEIYNRTTGQWTPAGNLQRGRAQHSATLLPDGRILILGGFDSTGISPPDEIYDPATGASTPLSSITQFYHTATRLPDGRVLVTGGGESSSLLGTFAVRTFSAASGQWTDHPNLISRRKSHTATLLTDGRVFIAGGHETGLTPIRNAEIWNPATASSTAVANMTTARGEHHAALLPGNHVLVFSGEATNAARRTETFGTTAWTSSEAPFDRDYADSVTLPSGRVLFNGGVIPSSSITLNSNQRYDPATKKWTYREPLLQPRAAHCMISFPDGHVLVTGGMLRVPNTLQAPLKSAELFYGDWLDLTIEAQFGTVTAAEDKLLYRPGETATLTATPQSGYVFSHWSEGLSGTDNPDTLVMDKDTKVTAIFILDPSDDDSDGLTNHEEVIHSTDPQNPDSDGDGLKDGEEAKIHNTNPLLADSDGDGLGDKQELEVHHTNPRNKDGDNDGFLDGHEVASGTDANSNASVPDEGWGVRQAVEIRFHAARGASYRIEASEDLETWTTIESGISGSGVLVSRLYSLKEHGKRYFRAKRE